MYVHVFIYSGLPFVHGPLLHDIGYNTVVPSPPKKKSIKLDSFSEKSQTNSAQNTHEITRQPLPTATRETPAETTIKRGSRV